MPRSSPFARVFPSGLPLLPVAPLVVLAVGLATAVIVALLGISQLARTSDDAAAVRAEIVAATLAARMRATPLEDRSEVLGRAARRSGTGILLVEQDGQVLINESYETHTADEVVQLLVANKGEWRTALGRVRFAARSLNPPLEHLSVIAFVPAPSPPAGSVAIVRAVATLTVLLLGLAVAVALSFTKTARDDVDYVRRRIVEMARAEKDPAGEPIPIRSLDQVGVLTAAFNVLVTRFAAAERSYRADLLQASAIDTEKSEFLAGLSHELRTPLNAILGFAHVLESEVDGPLSTEAKEMMTVVRTSGEHLRLLIDDILDLSAIETGSLQLAPRAVDVRLAAEQVIREAAATALRKPIKLAVEGDRGVFAHVDRRRLRQILTNLVSNAVKFTERGSVTVRIEARGEQVALVVTDTGPGIAAEDQGAIFEEYRQAGDHRARRAGTGLGLAIARRLSRMHGGDITVESAPGTGSSFTLTLPVYSGDLMEGTDPLSISGGYPVDRVSELPGRPSDLPGRPSDLPPRISEIPPRPSDLPARPAEPPPRGATPKEDR